MLILLSPAKTLHDPATVESPLPATEPLFADQARDLAALGAGLGPAGLARLMDLSDSLAALNAARFEAFGQAANRALARPAVLSFAGDVYLGLDAAHLSLQALARAQRELRILSGLYGLLRPLDCIEPYRLEMGTALAGPHGRSLYDLWRPLLVPHLTDLLQAEGDAPLIVNLASTEYSKALDLKALARAVPGLRVITPEFKESSEDGSLKSFFAHVKPARGRLARHLLERAEGQDPLKALASFSAQGWQADPARIDSDQPLFTRPYRPVKRVAASKAEAEALDSEPAG